MSGILTALTSVAAAVATQSTITALKRLLWNALGGVLVLIGAAFAVAAGYEALWLRFGTLEARLIMAAIFIVLGIIVFIGASMQAASRRRRASQGTAASVGTAFALGILGGMGRKKR